MGSSVHLRQNKPTAVVPDPLEAWIDLIVASETKDERGVILFNLADHYGLSSLSYWGFNLPRAGGQPVVLSTLGHEGMVRFLRYSYDPNEHLSERVLSRRLPYDWSELDRSRPDTAIFFEDCAAVGIGRQGLTFPLRGPSRDRAIIALTAEVDSDTWRGIRLSLLRDFSVLVPYLHDLVVRTSAEVKADFLAALNDRERECLRWAAMGKTTDETAIMLGITERTVRFHLDQAKSKLDCTNRTHAVARAMELGIVRAS